MEKMFGETNFLPFTNPLLCFGPRLVDFHGDTFGTRKVPQQAAHGSFIPARLCNSVETRRRQKTGVGSPFFRDSLPGWVSGFHESEKPARSTASFHISGPRVSCILLTSWNSSAEVELLNPRSLKRPMRSRLAVASTRQLGQGLRAILPDPKRLYTENPLALKSDWGSLNDPFPLKGGTFW